MAKSKFKPLSFDTTMRNPERIVPFLKVLAEFENLILTNKIIFNVIKRILREKLYWTLYLKRTQRLKEIYVNDDMIFSDDDIFDIIENSPQNHKEAGFDYGWSSRFDTWYNLPMEFGFCYYEMNKPVVISETGHMLIDAYKEGNAEKIQAIFLNAMVKYQTANPFRATLNENAPLILLLQVIALLRKDKDENGAGIARKELPLVICWTDNNAYELYQNIKELRKKYGFEYSNETIYDICFDKMNGKKGKDEKYFKLDKITGESVDDFLRKVRITGIVSLRGAGRFIDFNKFELDKIEYILKTYAKYKKYDSKQSYFEYMGQIDTHILEFEQAPVYEIDNIRKKALAEFAKKWTVDKINNELEILSKRTYSRDEILREISEPTRLEFLTAIALKQSYPTADICPNYKVDDEGYPIFTAIGGIADIECYDVETNSLFEVTLMRGKSQGVNEIPAITRHLLEAKEKEPNKTVFSVFISPNIHFDNTFMIKVSKEQYGVDIISLTITDFAGKRMQLSKISEYLKLSEKFR